MGREKKGLGEISDVLGGGDEGKTLLSLLHVRSLLEVPAP